MFKYCLLCPYAIWNLLDAKSHVLVLSALSFWNLELIILCLKSKAMFKCFFCVVLWQFGIDECYGRMWRLRLVWQQTKVWYFDVGRGGRQDMCCAVHGDSHVREERTVALEERWPCLIAVRPRTSALSLIAECHTLCELHERNNCSPHLISVINFTYVRSPFQCNLVLCVATYIHYSLRVISYSSFCSCTLWSSVGEWWFGHFWLDGERLRFFLIEPCINSDYVNLDICHHDLNIVLSS